MPQSPTPDNLGTFIAGLYPGLDEPRGPLTGGSSLRYDAKKRALILEAKKSGCVICGEARPACIDLHHTRDKVFSVAKHRSRSIQAVRDEIAKCVALCSNCHRLLHAGEVELP